MEKGLGVVPYAASDRHDLDANDLSDNRSDHHHITDKTLENAESLTRVTHNHLRLVTQLKAVTNNISSPTKTSYSNYGSDSILTAIEWAKPCSPCRLG